MDHPSRNIEDIGAEDNSNCVDLAQDVSMEENFSMWPRETVTVIFW
jgi:hypothetical protein